MSWLARSFVSSFRDTPEEEEQEDGEEIGTDNHGRGMKEDLSELTKSFTRQLWGVASFLAPPPAPDNPTNPRPSDLAPGTNPEPPVSKENYLLEPADRSREAWDDPGGISSSGSPRESVQRLTGIRSDFAEISGSVKTGLSRFSSNKAVHEISKLASTFLPFNAESDGEEDSGDFDEESPKSAVGVTEEVLTFARNISMHPETWLDFPLFSDEDDVDDFDMSDIQQEHALAVERLAPRLAALRIELCPGYMSEGRFWKIYFVLLHSRLNKQDALLLSTPQIVEARRLLLQELQNRTKIEPGNTGSDLAFSEGKSISVAQEQNFSQPSSVLDRNEKTGSFKIVSLQAATSVAAKDFQINDQLGVTSSQTGLFNDQVPTEESLIQNKDVLSGTVKLSDWKYEDEEAEADDWLEEEPAGTDTSVRTRTGLENEEDVSFSDLEDEDDTNLQTAGEKVKYSFDSSSKSSTGWVQLNRSSSHIGEGSTSYSSNGEDRLPGFINSKSDMLKSSENSGRDSVEQLAKKAESGETNDWLTVDEDDVVSADSS